MLDFIAIAAVCSIIGWVFAEILIKPGEVLAFWGRWINKYLVDREIINGREIEKEDFLFRPMGGCAKCFAGQLSLWVYLYFHGWGYHHWKYFVIALGGHIFTICLTILFTLIIGKIMDRL